jgi:hypothetical protein
MRRSQRSSRNTQSSGSSRTESASPRSGDIPRTLAHARATAPIRPLLAAPTPAVSRG